ncbi:hypothetical protein TREMEDRAFT_65069 [Tremella mesenterica DSM 1558]|uniref:uncharacterized protein n=1 Tax=Tremella mesenterica (strain ATCC 24925 / CBS 8224 / DSM 1558 / NBRC 9311 / NRRL Y-6157 / RJB 2259-6 / UBC 559-6) TaxID=578456 RepID=UPI00032C63AC|nr:uncharacterized protein TREMEDRAFT_65069 [Tremella mesenterica DSM 1558]EIW66677.1 hypothetical protein TREMEDRAFT_65069 [Tremella mesenterica DSM 1558]
MSTSNDGLPTSSEELNRDCNCFSDFDEKQRGLLTISSTVLSHVKSGEEKTCDQTVHGKTICVRYGMTAVYEVAMAPSREFDATLHIHTRVTKVGSTPINIPVHHPPLDLTRFSDLTQLPDNSYISVQIWRHAWAVAHRTCDHPSAVAYTGHHLQSYPIDTGEESQEEVKSCVVRLLAESGDRLEGVMGSKELFADN